MMAKYYGKEDILKVIKNVDLHDRLKSESAVISDLPRFITAVSDQKNIGN